MREKAKVIEDKGDYIIAKIERHSACSKCDQNCGLALDEKAEDMIVDIKKKNDITYHKGQLIFLEMKENRLVFSALMIYLLPLISMIAGYFAGDYLFNREGAGIIGSLIFLLLSFIFLKYYNNKIKNQDQFQPEISEIIK